MGAVPKENAELRFVLAFPDVYEVGMSHLGLQILYGILNAPEWLAAERVYAPWPDMEEMLRRENTPLATLETGLPLARADILGFTLQYELSYTNILNMLELSGIPLLAAERGDDWPLVIGGGPCAMNPEPLADFFDAFLLGDGEEAALEIASVVRDCRRDGCRKDELLARLAAIDTDQDGINDYNEIKLYETSAYLPDTDSDGIGDKQEIEAGTDPLCPEGADCAAESELPPGATSSPFVSPLQSSVITPGDILGTGSAPSAAASTSFDITSLVDNPADLRALILASGKIDPQELDKIDDATLVKLAKDLLNQSQTGSSPQ